MPLFAKKKDRAVQSLLLKLVNNNCPELRALDEGDRLDGRMNLTIAVAVVPFEGGRPLVGKSFTAVTKEFSTTGVAIVLDQPMGFDEVLLGFRFEQEVHYLRAVAKHLDPIGGGFYQLGMQMSEVVHPADYPELRSVIF